MGSHPDDHSWRDTLTAPDPGGFVDLMPYGVVLADPDAAAVWANRAWTEVTGQTQGRWRGRGWLDVCEVSEREVRRNEIAASARIGAVYNVDWAVSANGKGRRRINVRSVPQLDRGELVRIVVSAADVTDERARWDRLVDQATHDALTGLYNRRQFLEFLGHALGRRQRTSNGAAAVLFVDVDDLKAVNDKFGHAAGDQLLLDVAARIKEGVRPSDIVARYGGDEFTILCEDLAQARDADAIAERVREAVRGGPPGNLSISVGIAVVEEPEADPKSVVARADRAMYDTRRSRGRGLPGETTRTSARHDRRLEDDDHEGFRLIARTAHELRTPLTTIAGFAVTLRERRNRMEAVDVDSALAAIERQARQLAVMMDQLLERGRLRRDRPLLVAVDLADVVTDALEAAPPPDSVRLTLTADPSGSPLTVTAERSRLTCVLVNLLTNAFRHGGPNVSVDAHKGSAVVTVAVEDDGPGLPSGLEDAVFAPFVRVGTSPTSSRGSGLGLALARETAEYFGGHLTHEHVRPHGARFVLTLPAADPFRS